jgi:hypothetical protein
VKRRPDAGPQRSTVQLLDGGRGALQHDDWRVVAADLQQRHEITVPAEHERVALGKT